ncbi:hypothetical protein MAR_006409 [Mya arenaria]|uniref:Subtilisin n=1 Tax=Mya arenaria TaxID=6604 RepID=A0ABY7DAH7_MYAAR|nr:hypothetical protein MAR_006409 [Mya arenaria]
MTLNFILCVYFLRFVCAAEQTTYEDTIRIVIRSEEMFLDDITQSLESFDFHFDSRINDNLVIFEKTTNDSKNYQLTSTELTDLRQSNTHIQQLAQSYILYPESKVIAKATAYESEEQQSSTSTKMPSNSMKLCPPFFDLGLEIDTSWREHNASGRGIVVGVTDVGVTVGHDDKRCFTAFGGESAGTAIITNVM